MLIREKDLKNEELLEFVSKLKQSGDNSSSSLFYSPHQYSVIDNTTPRQFPDFSVNDEICNELTRELQLQSDKVIIPRVIHLKEHYSHNKEFRKLYKKLAETMIKKLGKNKISGLPSCMSLWKWASAELEALSQVMLNFKAKNLLELMEKIKIR